MLVLAVGYGDYVGDLLVGEGHERDEEVEVRLVLAGCCWVWLVAVWDEGAAAADGKFGYGCWGADADYVLVVEVGFTAVVGAVLVIEAAVELNDFELYVKFS